MFINPLIYRICLLLQGSSSSPYKAPFVVQSFSCIRLCNLMDRSTPSFPVFHYLPEFAHVYWVGDAIQPSHPLSSPSPLAFSLAASGSFPMSQFFASGGQSIGVSASASVLPMNIQGWFPLGLTGLISLLSKGFSRVFHSTSLKASIFQCSAFFIFLKIYLF